MPSCPVTDLSCISAQRDALPWYSRSRHSVDVYRQNCFLAGNGSSAYAYIPPLCCSTLRWQLTRQTFQLSEPVSQHGICPDHLSRKSALYRSLPQSTEQQALSQGHPFPCCSQQVGRSQRKARLAHLCRFRAISDTNRASALCR